MEWLLLLSEMLGLLFVLHNLICDKFVISRYTVAFLVIDILVLGLINVQMIKSEWQFIVYVFFVLYLWLEFRTKKPIDIFVYTGVSIFLMASIQIVAYMMLFMISAGKTRITMASAISLVIVFGIIKVFGWGEKCKYVITNNRTICLVIIFCGLIFGICIILSKAIKKFSFMDCLLIYTVFLLVVILCRQWKSEREKRLLVARELKYVKTYNEYSERLIQSVRSRQHEFNNKLEAIYSLQYVCSTYEELVSKQNELVHHVSKENHFSQLLICQCPAIIKGFLYSKFEEVHQNGIQISYDICMQDIPTGVMLDLQEIVGILFDNACEAVKEEEVFRKIYVKMYQNEKEIFIHVGNPFAYVEQKKIQQFLQEGYSSKGDNRGFGLSNVKQIVRKHKGMLSIENKDINGKNWFCIYVELSL